jgi:hypothetical protein
MAEATPTILEISKVYKAILDSTQEIQRYLRYHSSKYFYFHQYQSIFNLEKQIPQKNAFGK